MKTDRIASGLSAVPEETRVMPKKLLFECSALWTRPNLSPADIARLEQQNLIECRRRRSGLYRLTSKGLAAKAELTTPSGPAQPPAR